MTHLTTIVGSFQAKVVAARLGAEGIPAQLRGGIDGIYPIFDEVRVYVPEDQAATAREILLADSVDALFDDVSGFNCVDDVLAVEPAGMDDAPLVAPALATRRSNAQLFALTMVLIVVLVVVGYLAVMGSR